MTTDESVRGALVAFFAGALPALRLLLRSWQERWSRRRSNKRRTLPH